VSMNRTCRLCCHSKHTSFLASRISTQSSLNSQTSKYRSRDASAIATASADVVTLNLKTMSCPYRAHALREPLSDGPLMPLPLLLADVFSSHWPHSFAMTWFENRLHEACGCGVLVGNRPGGAGGTARTETGLSREMASNENTCQFRILNCRNVVVNCLAKYSTRH
jgi:hypothetical protein